MLGKETQIQDPSRCAEQTAGHVTDRLTLRSALISQALPAVSPLPEDTVLSPVLPQAPSPYIFTLETFSDHPHPQAEGGEP